MRQSLTTFEYAPCVAVCCKCHQGFVAILQSEPKPCFRCGGDVKRINPVPNALPYVDRHTVNVSMVSFAV